MISYDIIYLELWRKCLAMESTVLRRKKTIFLPNIWNCILSVARMRKEGETWVFKERKRSLRKSKPREGRDIYVKERLEPKKGWPSPSPSIPTKFKQSLRPWCRARGPKCLFSRRLPCPRWDPFRGHICCDVSQGLHEFWGHTLVFSCSCFGRWRWLTHSMGQNHFLMFDGVG